MDKNESDAFAHNQEHAGGEDSKHVSSLTPLSTGEAADSDQSSQYSGADVADSDADNDSGEDAGTDVDILDSYLDSDDDEEDVVAEPTTASAPQITTGPAAQPDTESAKGARNTDQPSMDEDEPTSKGTIDPIGSVKDIHTKSLATEPSTVSSVKSDEPKHEDHLSTTDSAVKQVDDSIDHSSKLNAGSTTRAVKDQASEHDAPSDPSIDHSSKLNTDSTTHAVKDPASEHGVTSADKKVDSIDHSSKLSTGSTTHAVKDPASEHDVTSSDLADADSTPAATHVAKDQASEHDVPSANKQVDDSVGHPSKKLNTDSTTHVIKDLESEDEAPSSKLADSDSTGSTHIVKDPAFEHDVMSADKQVEDSIDHSSKLNAADHIVKDPASAVPSSELADPDPTPAKEKAQAEESGPSAVDSSTKETKTVDKRDDLEIRGEQSEDASDELPPKQTGDADQADVKGDESEVVKTNPTPLESEGNPSVGSASEQDKPIEPDTVTTVDKHESKSAPVDNSTKIKQTKEIDEPETEKSIAEEGQTGPEDDDLKSAPIASSVDPAEEKDTSEIASVKSIEKDKTEALQAAPTPTDAAPGELFEDEKEHDKGDQAEDAIESKADKPVEKEKADLTASNEMPEEDDLAGSSTEKQAEAESGLDKPSMVDEKLDSTKLNPDPTVAASDSSTAEQPSDSREPEKEAPVDNDEKKDKVEKDAEEVQATKSALSDSDTKAPGDEPVESTEKEKSGPKDSGSAEQAKDETDQGEKAPDEDSATLSQEIDDNDESISSSEKVKEVKENDETQPPEGTVSAPTHEAKDISSSSNGITDTQTGAEPDSDKFVKKDEESEPSKSADLTETDNSLSEKPSTPLTESKPDDTKDVSSEPADSSVSESKLPDREVSPESADAPVSEEPSSGLKSTVLDSDPKDKFDSNVQESVSDESEQQERSIPVHATLKSSNKLAVSGEDDGSKEKAKELDAENVIAVASKSAEDKTKSGDNDGDSSDESEDDKSESGSDSSEEESDKESDEDSDESDSEEEQPKIYIYTSFTSGTHYVTPDTYRLASILEAHDIKFEVIDLATNERAKRLWKLWGKGRRLPAVIRDDEVVGNYSQIQEAVENSELREVVLEDEIMPYRP